MLHRCFVVTFWASRWRTERATQECIAIWLPPASSAAEPRVRAFGAPYGDDGDDGGDDGDDGDGDYDYDGHDKDEDDGDGDGDGGARDGDAVDLRRRALFECQRLSSISISWRTLIGALSSIFVYVLYYDASSRF